MYRCRDLLGSISLGLILYRQSTLTLSEWQERVGMYTACSQPVAGQNPTSNDEKYLYLQKNYVSQMKSFD